MKLKTRATLEEITNKSKSFKNSDYKDEEFKIVCKELSAFQVMEIHKKYSTIIDGKEDLDYIGMSAEQLANSIVEISGIYDEDGKDIEINVENIKQIIMFDNEFSQLLLNEYYNLFSKKKK